MVKHSRKWHLAAGAFGIICAFGSFGGARPALVWNFTASAPLGLYRVLDRPWVKGDWVAVKPEPRVSALLEKYGALDRERLLIKRVAAMSGDEVCRLGDSVTISGKVSAVARKETSGGAKLPTWGGCQRVRDGEVFLLGEADASFDGRYFGVTAAEPIVGPVTHLGR